MKPSLVFAGLGLALGCTKFMTPKDGGSNLDTAQDLLASSATDSGDSPDAGSLDSGAASDAADAEKVDSLAVPDGTPDSPSLPAGAPCVTNSACMSGMCPLCYPDRDGDGFGDMWSPPAARVCGSCGPGLVADNRDCLDDPSTFLLAASVNPNATFHNGAAPFPYNMYTPDPRDTTPDGWDWDCDDVRTLQFPNHVTGCASGASCSNACLPTSELLGTDTCGQFVLMATCANMCSSSSTCMTTTTSNSPQGCK